MKQHEATWSSYFNLFQLIYNLFQSISYVSECFPKIQKAFEIEILFHLVVEAPLLKGHIMRETDQTAAYLTYVC